MTETLDIATTIEALIADALASLDGEVTSRSRAVDLMLDLRNAAGGRDDIVAAIDSMLADAPGISTVPNAWILASLHEVRAVTLAISAD